MTDDGSRELFDRLKREGWPVVQAWVDDQEAETNHLEFKNKENAQRSEIDPGDFTEIAKSVSAFANTGGGLLVIGVDAGGGTKRGAGFDRVRRTSPISGVEAFGGALERRIKNLCDPPIAGLAVQVVCKPAGSDGIVAIHVPVSDSGPHRAVNVSADVNDRYYMRTAAGAQTMPHSLLADRFGRAAHPRLRLRVKVGPASPFAFVLSLVNEGRGAARRPAIILKKFRLQGGDLQWPSHPSQDGETGFVLRALPYGEIALESWLLEPFEDLVVYPGVSRGVFSFWTSLDQTPEKITPVVLEYSAELHALDTQPVWCSGRLEINSIMDLLNEGTFESEG